MGDSNKQKLEFTYRIPNVYYAGARASGSNSLIVIVVIIL